MVEFKDSTVAIWIKSYNILPENMVSLIIKKFWEKLSETVIPNSKLLWENDFIFTMSLLKLPTGI